MSDIEPYQIITILVFLGILVCAQIVIKRLSVRGKFTPLKNVIKVTEKLNITSKEQLLIIRVREQEFLFSVSKSGPSNIIQLNSLDEEYSDA